MNTLVLKAIKNRHINLYQLKGVWDYSGLDGNPLELKILLEGSRLLSEVYRTEREKNIDFRIMQNFINGRNNVGLSERR